MIGESEKEQHKMLSKKENIFFLGKKKHSELQNYIKNFDCGIMPYKINKFTDAIYPAKLNELLAVGKPVISTNIYEVSFYNKENQNIIDIANTSEDFCNLIETNIKNDNEEKINQKEI